MSKLEMLKLVSTSSLVLFLVRWKVNIEKKLILKFFISEGPLKEVFNYKITPDNSTIEMIDLGEALGGMREATAEIVGNSLVSYLKVPSGEIDMIATRSMDPSKYFTIYSKDFQAFWVALVRRLTSAEFAFLFMVSNPYVL